MPFKRKSHILCISTIIMPLLKKQFKLNEGTDCVYTYTCIDYPEGVFDVSSNVAEGLEVHDLMLKRKLVLLWTAHIPVWML